MQKSITFITALLAMQPLFPNAQQRNIPEIRNETFIVRTTSMLSASANKKGDKFTLQILAPEQYKNGIIEAEVSKAKAAGRVQGKSELLFSFNSLTLPGNQAVPIAADLKSVTNSKGISGVDEEGRVIGKSSTKKDVATAAALSGLGAIVGGIAGGGSGAAKGAAIGAAVGLTIAFSTKGEDIKFAPGTTFQLVVNSRPERRPNP